jgi:hypothetical protein
LEQLALKAAGRWSLVAGRWSLKKAPPFADHL